jgi:hypothetical protein
MNSIAAKNNTIIALHFDDEEHGSERLAPYDELHGCDLERTTASGASLTLQASPTQSL